MQTDRQFGDFAEVIVHFDQVLEELRELDSPQYLAMGLLMYGAYLAYHGRLAKGQLLLEESLALCQIIGVKWLFVAIQNELAFIACEQSRFIEAINVYTDALNTARSIGFTSHQSQAITGLGKVAIAQNNEAAAQDHLTQALQLAWSVKLKFIVLHTLTWFAALHQHQGKYEQAVALLSCVHDSPFSEKRDKLEAECQLATLASTLDSEAFEKARTKGESLKLEDVVQELLVAAT